MWFISLNWHIFLLYMIAIVDFVLESNIEDFIQSLKHQNIVLEIDDFKNRNGTNDLSYNGAIIVSGQQQVCLPFPVFCFYGKKLIKWYILTVLKLQKVSPASIQQLDLNNFGSLLNNLWDLKEVFVIKKK